MSREKTKCITSIGGQALIEGILMRGPKKTEVAVRMSDGTISTEELCTSSLREKYSLLRLPLLRGIAGFIDSLSSGYKALALSVDKAGLEETEEPSKFDKWIEKTFGDKMMNVIMLVSSVLGVALAIALFFILPTFLFNLLQTYVAGAGIAPWRSVFEGVLRIVIFIVYIVLCSRLPEIHRLFQ